MEKAAGVILSGGLSRRMGGGDKGLRRLKGTPLIAHVIGRLEGQASPLALNANGDLSRFSGFGLPLIADATADFAGPLAGVLAGMRWAAKAAPNARFLVTAPCDAPFLPRDLVARLLAALEGFPSRLALANSAGKAHPVIGLWPIALADDLASSLAAGVRRVLDWTHRQAPIMMEFPFADIAGERVDPFFNVNTPEDLAQAERLLDLEQAL